MHWSPLRNLLLQDVAPRCCFEMCSLCLLCCVAPALCPAQPGPVRLTPSNPRNYQIAKMPICQIAEALILTESRNARRCRVIQRDSDNPGYGSTVAIVVSWQWQCGLCGQPHAPIWLHCGIWQRYCAPRELSVQITGCQLC